MKVWHDDIRKPPDDSWTWARTNAAAIALLEQDDVVEISMDHDLGLDEIDPDANPEAIYWAGRSESGSGLDLVRWMCANGRVPPAVTIHSWNPDGARAMAQLFNDHGYSCVVAPYEVPQP